MSSVVAEAAIGAIASEQEPPPHWHVLARLEKTAIGTRGAGGITSVRRREPAGCLLFGPYWQLPAGSYRLSFRCRPGKPRLPSEPVLGVEVIAMNRVQLAWRDLTTAELQGETASLDFTVPPILGLGAGDEARLEFRFFHLRNAGLTITGVDLRGIENIETPPPSRWRMLGRLGGGRSFLQLPEGQYRLAIRSDAGSPRMAGEPVLRVEITARRRWQDGRWWSWNSLLGRPPPGGVQLACRDFTAEELGCEAAWFDFEVPAELALEGGHDIVIGLRLHRLAHAGLTIKAVDLTRITQAEAVPVPRQWELNLHGIGGEHPPKRMLSLISPQRTRVLIIGNCQAQTVHEALARSGEFDDRLHVKYHFVALHQNLHEAGKTELESSDVLLVQDIRDWESYPLRPHIQDGVRIIKFPILHFASLWPFDHYNGPGDKEAYEREWPNLTFLYQDGLLARLRKEIPNREQRFLAYRTLSIDGIINFTRLHDFEKRRLIAMDKQFGCEIGRFILDHFQRRRLFYTTNHPNAQILGMLMQYLLKQLEMDQGYRPSATLDHLRRLQVPVHPKVAQALGVTWAKENTKYLYGGEQITWETYVRRYIDHYG